MGIPSWAQAEATATTSSAPSQDPAVIGGVRHPWNRYYPPSFAAKSMFPVHRIEDSPVLAHYQEGTAGSDVPESKLPAVCNPDDVMFTISKEYVTSHGNHWCPSDHEHKMVDLRSLDVVREVAVSTANHERNMLPTSTMIMEKNPDLWYRKFSRNIHGLRKDKPYANLQWPPGSS